MEHIYLIIGVLGLLSGYILYNQVIPTIDLIVILCCGIVFYKLSRHAKGNSFDKQTTMVILFSCVFIFYYSYNLLINIGGFAITNPFILLFICFQLLLYTILIISRYTTLNFIKVVSWVFGLSTILMFVFTLIVYNSIEICYSDSNQTQLYDSSMTTYLVYFGWFISILLLGLFEEYQTIYPTITPFLIISSVGIAVYIVSRAVSKCKTTDDEIKQLTNVKTKKTMFGIVDDDTDAITSGDIETKAENLTITNEYSWINNSVRILTVVSYICLVLGHASSAIWYSFLGYYIVSQCGPVGDPRKYPIVFCMLICILYFMFAFIKHLSRKT